MDEDKSKEQLIREIHNLRRQVEECKQKEKNSIGSNIFKLANEEKTILNNVRENLILQDVNHKILWANKAAAKSANMEPADMVGRYCYEIWNNGVKPCSNCPVALSIDSGEMHEREVTTSDGRIWIARSYPIKDSTGNLKSIVDLSLDITDYKKAEEKAKKALKEQIEFLKILVDTIPYPIYCKDKNGLYKWFNQSYKRQLELNQGSIDKDVIGCSAYDLWPRELADKFQEKDAILLMETGTQCFEMALQNKYGMERDLIFNKSTYKDINGNIAGLVGIVIDITERKKMEEKLRKWQEYMELIVQNMQDIILLFDKEIRIKYASPSIALYFDTTPEEVKNVNIFDKIHSIDVPRVKEVIDRSFKHKVAHKVEFRVYNNVKYIWFEANGKPLQDDEGNITGSVVALRNIDERKQMEGKLKYMGSHDILTDLYNRRHFEQEMNHLEKKGVCPVGIIVCDVDGLKLINDTIGHESGDKMLLSAANIIKKSTNDGYVSARIGGDEFAILIPADKNTVESIYQRIEDEVQFYNAEKREIYLSISAGVAVRNDNNTSLNDLFKEADNNMYREKLHSSQSARSVIVQTLMTALEARDFITEGHANRLKDLVVRLAQSCGLSKSRMADLQLFAQFHDIGKVGVPDRILFKEGPLTYGEKAEMQRHCEIGLRIAQSSPELKPIADWILKHHEWWDGNGYPLGLKGEDIPLACRILAIADAYDAMTSDRPYRKAMSHRQAVEELKGHRGTQFDPRLIDIFIQLLKVPVHSEKISFVENR